VHKLMGRMLKRCDVSPMQCRTLMFLHDAEDSVNQKTLERHLMIKPSTVNGIVDTMSHLMELYISPPDATPCLTMSAIYGSTTA